MIVARPASLASSARSAAGWPVAAAASAWVGAEVATPLPTSATTVCGAVVVVVIARRVVPPAVWVCVVVAVLADVGAVRSLAGLDDLAPGDFDGVVALVTDAEAVLDGWRFEADGELGHLLVEVPEEADDPGGTVAALLAGHRVHVRGTVEPFTRTSEWTMSRHLVGTLAVTEVVSVADAPAPLAVANAYRRLLDRGGRSLSSDQRSLLAGIVIGDDRAQPPELTADFRASGLTHLLAVSGQNLVFVLVVVAPLLRRLRLWPRYVVAVAVVVGFATVTRFEPSVTRAAAVAVVALLATTLGRPGAGLRHLGIAVVGLILVDPLLVHALGFRLSVAASIGVLVLAPPVTARLRGPRWVREGLGITIGAQLAVAPVLVPTFGSMPVAAIPANLLAAPLAGFTMVWGLLAGTVAGVVGGRVAAVLHVPTACSVTALEKVAAWSAALPTGYVDLRHVAVVLAAVVATIVAPGVRHVAVVAVACVLVSAAVVAPPVGEYRVGYDATVWIDGTVAVVEVGRRARPVDVLDRLRRSRVRRVGLVVSVDADTADVVDAVGARFPIDAVVGPPSHADAVTPPVGTRIRVARLVVVVDDDEPRLRVRIGWR